MIRLMMILLFLAMACVTSESNAQHRRWLNRAPRAQRVQHQHIQQTQVVDQAQVADVIQPSDAAQPANEIEQGHPRRTSLFPRGPARIYDPRIMGDDDSMRPFPKYFGGFHSSQIYNLGIPTGDLGFRGNGIYWAPW